MSTTRTKHHTFLFFGKSDIGMVREENQDSFRIELPEQPDLERGRGRLVVLADGMGGLAHGGQASRIAVECIAKTYYESDLEPEEDALSDAVSAANREIYAEAQELPGNQPMGSTVTAMAIFDDRACIAQVGDSRAYRFSEEKGLTQITRDHTLVQELADRGEIEPDSLHYLLNRNVLTRGLGLQEDVEIDLFPINDLAAGETFLLCSDGLYDVVAESEIESHVLSYGSAIEELVNYLLELARSRGAPDNVTVVVVRVEAQETFGGRGFGAAAIAVSHSESRRASVITPISYFLVFALGVVLTLLFQIPRGATSPAARNASLEESATHLRDHALLQRFLRETESTILTELEKVIRWSRRVGVEGQAPEQGREDRED